MINKAHIELHVLRNLNFIIMFESCSYARKYFGTSKTAFEIVAVVNNFEPEEK